MKSIDYLSPDIVRSGKLSVTYIVNETGVKLIRTFQSEYLARKFARKLKYSRKCKLVATSGFFI